MIGEGRVVVRSRLFVPEGWIGCGKVNLVGFGLSLNLWGRSSQTDLGPIECRSRNQSWGQIMRLDVGIVQIGYLDRPRGAAYRFARHLAGEWDDDSWEVSSGENVFPEYDYDHLLGRAYRFVVSDGLASAEAHQVMWWVRGLPWRGRTIMLHLGW